MDDIEVPIPHSIDELNMTGPQSGLSAPLNTFSSAAESPSKGFHAIAAAAGASASTVGALAAAAGGSTRWGIGLAALAGVLSFLGAFAKAPNTVKVAG
jgi:hypothetical protein